LMSFVESDECNDFPAGSRYIVLPMSPGWTRANMAEEEGLTASPSQDPLKKQLKSLTPDFTAASLSEALRIVARRCATYRKIVTVRNPSTSPADKSKA
jgi:hypothetical protein